MDLQKTRCKIIENTLASYLNLRKGLYLNIYLKFHEDNIDSPEMAYKISFCRIGKYKFGTFGFEDDFVVTKFF